MGLNNIQKVNFYPQFKNWYFKILRRFKFDYKKDIEAAELLSELLKRKGKSWNLIEVLNFFQDHVQSKKDILIYGCGPSLEETVIKLKNLLGDRFFKQRVNLAADGASILLKDLNIPIDAIFTDLDGISKDEFDRAKFIIIHAHGDNIDKVIDFEDVILNCRNLIGTVQVDPLRPTINPGGFTDGDRILFFLRSFLLPQHRIFLIGMDFKNRVGKYSKLYLNENQKASKVKRKKLKFALKLLKWFHKLVKNEIIFINSELRLKQFKNLSIEDFVRLWCN